MLPDEGTPDRDGQSARNQTCRYRRNMTVMFHQVCPGGGWTIFQGGLQDGAYLWRDGIRGQRGDTFNTAALEEVITGGELGVPPN